MSTDHSLEDQPLDGSIEVSDSQSVQYNESNDNATTAQIDEANNHETVEVELTDITTNSFELDPTNSQGSLSDNEALASKTTSNKEDKLNTELDDELNNELNKQMNENLIKSAPVEINILGKVYTINCPVGEEEELSSATDYINSFIQSIRDQAPMLSYEHLLVLCSLNLYEQIQEAKKLATSKEDEYKEANKLVEQMIEGMKISES